MSVKVPPMSQPRRTPGQGRRGGWCHRCSLADAPFYGRPRQLQFAGEDEVSVAPGPDDPSKCACPRHDRGGARVLERDSRCRAPCARAPGGLAPRQPQFDRARHGAGSAHRAHLPGGYHACGGGGCAAAGAGPESNDPRFQRTLDERLEALKPYVRAIFVIGADGLVQHDTDYPKTPTSRSPTGPTSRRTGRIPACCTRCRARCKAAPVWDGSSR